MIDGKADNDANSRRHRDGQQDTGKAEQGAADHEREDDPNRVQPDLIADKFRREKNGFQYLPHREHRQNQNYRLPFAELNHGNRNGNGPECLSLLIEAGADVNIADNDGETPCYIAARYGKDECLSRVIET